MFFEWSRLKRLFLFMCWNAWLYKSSLWRSSFTKAIWNGLWIPEHVRNSVKAKLVKPKEFCSWASDRMCGERKSIGTEMSLLGISSSPKKSDGVQKSDESAVKLKNPYLECACRPRSPTELRCAGKLKGLYFSYSRIPMEFRDRMDVLWNLCIVTCNELVTQEVQHNSEIYLEWGVNFLV